ncbi:MAG: Gldg family protein [Myxococcota bacterium]
MAEKRNTGAASSLGLLILSIGIVGALNFIFTFLNVGRWDVTDNRLWSLSDGSRDLVADLDDRMEIRAYFTENLPPPFNATEQYVRDILSEYEAASGGNVVVRFISPEEDEDREAAEADGIQAVPHQKIENDAVSVVEGYRGLAIEYLGETKTIPVIQDQSGLEYTITMAIKEMVGDRRPIGVVTGHDGPSLEEGLSGLRDSLPTYELRGVSASEEIDRELAALLVVAPATPFSEVELQRINQFVMHGGSLGVFGGSTKLNIEGPDPSTEAIDSGINQLLTTYGATVQSDVVLDWQCSRAPMRGPMGLQVAVPYPAVPIATFTDEQMEHPALFRIPTAVLPFTSSLTLTSAPEGVNVDVLARSSDNSWRDTGGSVSLRPRHPREWRMTGDAGPFPLMVGIEGSLPSAFAASTSGEAPAVEAPAQSEDEVRVLVAGTAAFMRDEFLPQGQQGPRQLSGGLAFALNAIDWLAAESDLIAIRAKNIEDPALEIPAAVTQAQDAAFEAEEQAREAAEGGDLNAAQESVDERDEALEERKAALEAWDSKKSAYRWLNTLGIPFIFALFGVIRWRQRNAKRRNLKL